MFDQQTRHGAYFATSAYVFWGVAPIYFKWLSHVSPFEILIQRVLWSIVLLLGILAYTGQLTELKIEKRKLGLLLVSALLLATNWLIFIYSVIASRIVETSLGYFINPLVSVFLGMIFLKERLRPLQWIAITVAAIGIGVQLFFYGALPWISLTLALTFGFYGLIRKNLSLHSVAGLALETMMVAPIAIVGLIWLMQTEGISFLHVDIKTDLLLVAAGFVTSFPLLCFSAAVTRLSLTAAGLFQYIAPSLSLMLAVLLYGEPFGLARVITFCCIWTALGIFTFETLYHHRKLARQLSRQPELAQKL